MAITINVTGNATGGGGSQQSNQSYSQSLTPSGGVSLPSSDVIIQDIRREIASRGVMLIPGTSNFSTMMNSIRMQQRNALMDRIDVGVDNQRRDIELQRSAAVAEVSRRVEAEKHEALLRERDPLRQASIMESYDNTLKRELRGVDREFNAQISELSSRSQSEKNEVEQRLTML